MTKVFEIVKYKALASVTDEEILDVSTKLQELVTSQKGLVSRTLAKSEDGEWIDVVIWESLEDAMKAAELINTHPVGGEFMSKVQVETVTMKHYSFQQGF